MVGGEPEPRQTRGELLGRRASSPVRDDLGHDTPVVVVLEDFQGADYWAAVVIAG